jgi:tRNA nucleotidyltransferase/poly(A) polymerase
MIDKYKILDEALYVLNKLKENDYATFLVGGCVRDLLLNKTPNDFDVTTQALPEQVIQLFDHTIPTGLTHGTVTVIINKIPIEVTTFRSDGKYTDNRRPDSVKFGVTIEEDVSRRDFTINGLLYDGEKVIDYVGGLSDLKYKEIRCVGVAFNRFSEDKLRVMRAIRFACQLDFKICSQTYNAISFHAKDIVNISQERIRDELVKILLSDKPSEGIKLLSNSGILQYILPELQLCAGFDQHNIHNRKNVFDHILKVLDSTPAVLNVRLSALFHDISKPDTFKLKIDIKEIWKDIENFEGLYQVSNLGNIKSLSREVPNGKSTMFTKQKVLSPRNHSAGYYQICLCNNGENSYKYIHRLVAKAFIPNPENKPTVNHKDGNKKNNYVGNLEWATYPENKIHAFETGISIPTHGQQVWNSILKESDISTIKDLNKDGYNQREIADKYGVNKSVISRILSGDDWKEQNKIETVLTPILPPMRGTFYGHHKVGADKTREIMRRLKFDNETIDNVCILVYEHMSRYPHVRKGSVKKLLRRIGEQNVDDLINLQLADIIGSKPPYNFEDVILLKNELKRIIETKEPISVKQLAVNGYDLMELGVKQGKRMGEILNKLLQIVMEDPKSNNKELLLEIVRYNF